MSRNGDLKRYTELTLEISKLEAEKEMLREKLLKIGNHASQDFVCTVTIQERRQLPGLKVLELDPSVWPKIEPLVTVKEIPMIKVVPKGGK